MACRKSPASAAENGELPITMSYSGSEDEGRSDCWRKELLNGQVIVVLTAREPYTPASFNLRLCAEKLKTWGIQMTTDQWRNLIQHAVLEPDVRKYMFYNSRAFGIAIAVIIYVTLWINLYSTLQKYSLVQDWERSLLVTLVALVGALIIRLMIHRRDQKMDMNTDIRLAAANEIFMRNQFLVGITDVLDKHRSTPRLWFVHFDVEPCRRSLATCVMEMKRSNESAFRHRLDKLCIVIETLVLPGWGEKAERSLEEMPLLPDRESSCQSALTCREVLQLIPDGPPEVMAQALLTIFSSYYIRLLVSGQLPRVPAGRHVAIGGTPCLCQFIESMVLGRRPS